MVPGQLALLPPWSRVRSRNGPPGPNLDPVHEGPQCQSHKMVPCPAAVPLQDTASTWQTQCGRRLPVQVLASTRLGEGEGNVRESHQLPPLGKQHRHAHTHTHTYIHTYTPAYLPHSSSVPFLSVDAIRVAGAHAILIAHGHSPIAALSSVHINFPVISYTYTALVVLVRPCDVCLCGRSQSSGGKHRLCRYT